MTHHMRIAVLGAGYLGGAVAQELVAQGHEVWAVRRGTAGGGHDGVTWLSGDVTVGAIAGLPDALDAVVLTVAPGRGADGYMATYPPAAAGAVAIARSRNARRLIYTSSTGVYGGRDGAWVTEASPVRGTGDANVALIAAEDAILSADIYHASVLRVAGIYGPGRDPRVRLRNTTVMPQRGEYWTNFAHRDDIVSSVLHVLQLTSPGPLFNVSDGTPSRAVEIARWLCAQEGSDPDALIFEDTAHRSRSDQRVSNGVLVDSGWAPEYPSFREGFMHGLT